MPRYIDADALNAAIEKWFDSVCVYDVSPSEATNDFQSIVDEQPTISPDEVRGVGEWLHDVGEFGFPEIPCSVCGYKNGHYGFNYCPSCGARMGGVQDALS